MCIYGAGLHLFLVIGLIERVWEHFFPSSRQWVKRVYGSHFFPLFPFSWDFGVN